MNKSREVCSLEGQFVKGLESQTKELRDRLQGWDRSDHVLCDYIIDYYYRTD